MELQDLGRYPKSCKRRERSVVQNQEEFQKKQKERLLAKEGSAGRIELPTSSTLRMNHTTRPSGRLRVDRGSVVEKSAANLIFEHTFYYISRILKCLIFYKTFSIFKSEPIVHNYTHLTVVL